MCYNCEQKLPILHVHTKMCVNVQCTPWTVFLPKNVRNDKQNKAWKKYVLQTKILFRAIPNEASSVFIISFQYFVVIQRSVK